MTWIQHTPFNEAQGELRRLYDVLLQLYPQEYHTPVPTFLKMDGQRESIIAAHSLIPEAMWHIMAGLSVLLRPDLPLSRRQQEMIATVVSAQNRCFY
jgi:hypothetical protein